MFLIFFFFFFQAEDGIRDFHVTGVQTCALPISEPDPPDHPGAPGLVHGAGERGRHDGSEQSSARPCSLLLSGGPFGRSYRRWTFPSVPLDCSEPTPTLRDRSMSWEGPSALVLGDSFSTSRRREARECR